MLMETSREDVRSITGSNYRKIMLLVYKTSVLDVSKRDVDNIENFNLCSLEFWKVDSIIEILQVKKGKAEVPGFEKYEIDNILHYLHTS